MRDLCLKYQRSVVKSKLYSKIIQSKYWNEVNLIIIIRKYHMLFWNIFFIHWMSIFYSSL